MKGQVCFHLGIQVLVDDSPKNFNNMIRCRGIVFGRDGRDVQWSRQEARRRGLQHAADWSSLIELLP